MVKSGDLITGMSIFEFQTIYPNTNYTAYYDAQNRINIVVL